MPGRVGADSSGGPTVPSCGVWERLAARALSMALAGVTAGAMAGCGSGDSTVSKTPLPTATSPAAAPTPAPSVEAAPSTPPPNSPAPPDPCAVNLAAPAIARAVSELPRDPRSGQGWNPEPVSGNYNECAPLSAVIVKANTNADNPNTRAVLFHLGKYIPTGVPDTYGFNGIDPTQSTGDTVALMFQSGLGLSSVVKFRWNGNEVELIPNT